MTSDDTQIGKASEDAVYDVSVEVYAVLGTATLPIAQLLKLGRGAVVELERKVNDPIDLYVNQRRVATADVGVSDDRLIVTVLDVLKRATE
jgi:flagellar motor switch protein FliN/FliY